MTVPFVKHQHHCDMNTLESGMISSLIVSFIKWEQYGIKDICSVKYECPHVHVRLINIYIHVQIKALIESLLLSTGCMPFYT